MARFPTWIGGTAAGLLAATAFLAVPTQAQHSEPDTSLAALTAEVRLLREAIEKSSQAQSQLQALTVYLSAQQSRLVQTSSRADALAKDLDAAMRQATVAAEQVAQWETLAGDRSQPAEFQRELPSLLARARQDQARAITEERQVRTRAMEADSAVRLELARWNDLISRLEQATR